MTQETALVAPPPTIEFKIGDDIELRRMSHGLLRQLLVLCPAVEKVADLLMNPEISDQAMCAILTKRGDKGVITDRMDAERLDGLMHDDLLDLETYDMIMMWAQEHIIYFFAKRVSGMAETLERQTSTMVTMVQQAKGLQQAGMSMSDLSTS